MKIRCNLLVQELALPVPAVWLDQAPALAETVLDDSILAVEHKPMKKNKQINLTR